MMRRRWSGGLVVLVLLMVVVSQQASKQACMRKNEMEAWALAWVGRRVVRVLNRGQDATNQRHGPAHVQGLS